MFVLRGKNYLDNTIINKNTVLSKWSYTQLIQYILYMVTIIKSSLYVPNENNFRKILHFSRARMHTAHNPRINTFNCLKIFRIYLTYGVRYLHISSHDRNDITQWGVDLIFLILNFADQEHCWNRQKEKEIIYILNITLIW